MNKYVMLKDTSPRVLNSQAGMIFQLEFDGRTEGLPYSSIRDYRYPHDNFKYQVWALSQDEIEYLDEEV